MTHLPLQKQPAQSDLNTNSEEKTVSDTLAPPAFQLKATESNAPDFQSPMSTNGDIKNSTTEIEASIPIGNQNNQSIESENQKFAELPDIHFPQTGEYDQFDAVSGNIGYKATINLGGTQPGGFGVTRPYQTIKNIKIRKKANAYQVKFVIQRDLLYTARASKGPNNQLDVGSASSPHLTKANYKTAVSDLTPNMSDLNGRPPRSKFWSRKLTLVHEKFHADEDVRFGKNAIPAAKTWLNGQNANTISDCHKLIQAAGRRVETAVAAGMAFPGREERAYGDGAPKYKALANSIKKKGDAGKYK